MPCHVSNNIFFWYKTVKLIALESKTQIQKISIQLSLGSSNPHLSLCTNESQFWVWFQLILSMRHVCHTAEQQLLWKTQMLKNTDFAQLISSTSLDLDPVLVVLLVVELRPVVQHQVQVGGRVTLVHLTAANTWAFQKCQKFNVQAANTVHFWNHLVARCSWKTWCGTPASPVPPAKT